MSFDEQALQGVNLLTGERSGGAFTARVAPGTYANTYFKAFLAVVTAGQGGLNVAAGAFALAAGQTIPVLLFTADTPIECNVRSTWDGLQLVGPIQFPAPFDLGELWTAVSDEATQAAGFITPAANVADTPPNQPGVQKQNIVAVTDTLNVGVTGHLGVIDIQTRVPAIENPLATPVDPNLELECVAEGAVLFGPTRNYDAGAVANSPAVDAQCIIMNETLYSDAIQRALNTFVGLDGVRYHVVGIYGPQFTRG